MGQINQTEFRVNREHFVVEHFSVPSNPSCFEEAYHKIFLNFFSNYFRSVLWKPSSEIIHGNRKQKKLMKLYRPDGEQARNADLLMGE